MLHAQPIIDLASGDITQYELLLRMRRHARRADPARGVPARRRALRPHRGDRQLGRHARDRDARRGAHAARTGCFEVNISGRSTGDPELLELIERELARTGVEPEQLIFEITETTAVANIPRAQEFAARTSPSSAAASRSTTSAPASARFYYLKHLPFDYLKIDGEFVRSLPRRPHRPARHPGGRRHRAGPRQAHGRRDGRRPARRSSCWPSSASTTRRATTSASPRRSRSGSSRRSARPSGPRRARSRWFPAQPPSLGGCSGSSSRSPPRWRRASPPSAGTALAPPRSRARCSRCCSTASRRRWRS